MKQITKSLLSLGLLGALAGGVAIFAYVRTSATTGGIAQHEDALLRLNVERITRLEIEDQGHSFRVERDAGGWTVATPVRIAADPEQVQQVLSGLSRLRAKKRFTDVDPAPRTSAMGLDEPAAVISAWTDDEPPQALRIELGAVSEFNHQEYARYTGPGDDEPLVVMLASGSKKSVVKPAAQLYDRRVLGARADEIVRLRVEPSVPADDRVAFTLERSSEAIADAGFRCTAPFEGEVDLLAVRRVMEGLLGAPVSEFLTLDAGGELAPFGLDKPAFKVTAWIRPDGAGDDEPLIERTVLIGELQPGDDGAGSGFVRVARSDQPWVGVANAVMWHALPHDVDALKTKRLTAVNRAKVRRIEMELISGEHVALERRDGQDSGWSVLAPEPGRAKPQVVNAFLLAVSGLTGVARELEGDGVKDAGRLEALGLGEKSQRVRLLDDEGEPLAVLRVGNVDGEEVFVLREGADFVARVSRKRLADLPEKAAALLE